MHWCLDDCEVYIQCLGKNSNIFDDWKGNKFQSVPTEGILTTSFQTESVFVCVCVYLCVCFFLCQYLYINTSHDAP